MQFQAPRGTSDILPDDQPYWRLFQDRAQQVARDFGYRRIDTPMFEDARLFVRGIGEVTDIVEKETYTFEDRGGDSLTLRPEGTAPVCRAYLEHGMFNLPQPVRLFYLCPVFRYERPQSGRYRQHHQFGIEAYGDADASIDAEIIELGWRFLESLGLRDLSLSVNSIGDPACRPAYVQRLREHYAPHAERLCDDCQRRLDRNPLRLLDCKQDGCQPVIDEAPHSADHLCDDCAAHWSDLLDYLAQVGIQGQVDHRLVRGFDYYTRTVFEVTPPVEGRMNTLFGGGRYDGLIEEIGGRPTPGVGYGMGIERVIANLKRQGVSAPRQAATKVLVAHIGPAAKREAVRLASALRRDAVSATVGPARGLRSQMRYANTIGATHVAIIGDDELVQGVAQLRDLSRSEQRAVPLDALADALAAPQDAQA